MRSLLEEAALGRQTVTATEPRTSRSRLAEAGRRLAATLSKGALLSAVIRGYWPAAC